MFAESLESLKSGRSAGEAAALLLAAGLLRVDDRGGWTASQLIDDLAPSAGPFDAEWVPLARWALPSDNDLDAVRKNASTVLEMMTAVRRRIGFGGTRGDVVRVWFDDPMAAEELGPYIRRNLSEAWQVRVACSYARATPAPPGVSPRWTWPLVLGVDRRIVSTMRRSNQDPWFAQITKVVDASTRSCSLAVTSTANARDRRSSAAVFHCSLDQADEPALAEMISTTYAYASITADPMEASTALLYQLSHDLTLDVALDAACEYLKIDCPALFADPDFLNSTTVRGVGGDLLNRLRDGTSLQHGAEAKPVYSFGVGPVLHEDLQCALIDQLDTLHSFSFDHESNGAVQLARVADDARAPMGRREGRCLTARALVDGQTAEVLAANETHRLLVAIGPRSEVRSASAGSMQFPDEALPWSGVPIQLDVALVELKGDGRISQQTITCPPVGWSDAAEFEFRAPAEGVFRARIVVSRECRIIQTALIEWRVGEQIPPFLEIEAIVRQVGPDVAGLRPHDVAIVLNHVGRQPLVAALTSTESRVVAPAGLDQIVNDLREVIHRAVNEPQDFTSIEQPAFQEMMVDLALLGRELYETMFAGESGAVISPGLSERLKTAKRISVLAARPGIPLPLELVYSRDLDDGAHWCPQAIDALRLGRCPSSCAAGTEATVVCPLGFWAFSKVIERHQNPAGSLELQQSGYADGYTLQTDSTAGAEVIRLTGVLAAGSSRADENESQAWSTAKRHLERDLGSKVAFVSTWDEWEKAVRRKTPPGVLLLVAHVADDNGVHKLEVGDGSLRRRLTKAVPTRSDRPLVLLLGCETGSGAQPLQDFSASFLRAGAKAVISTFTVVRGRWAAPLGVELVRELGNTARQGRKTGGMRVGDALLKVRRECLADNPMVLSLVAYGDADFWIEP